MPTNYPTSLDTTTELPDVAADTPLASAGGLKHSQQHINAADALRAIQVKLGIAAGTDYDSLSYRVQYDAHTLRGATVATDSDEFDGSSLPGTYSWINQGTCTATVSNGVLRFAYPQGGSTTCTQLMKTVASGTSWRYEGMFSYPMRWTGYTFITLGVRYASTGKWVGMGALSNFGDTSWLMALVWGTNTSYTSDTRYAMANPPSRIWYAIERSGSDIHFEYSLNGINWLRQFSITTSGAEIGNAPDQIGITMLNNGSTSGYNAVAHISYIRRVS